MPGCIPGSSSRHRSRSRPTSCCASAIPEAESAALEAVASWATQFTPAVALAPPDAVLAEIGGSLRLFGGLPGLTARLSRGAHDLGYAARWAFAPTSAAALLFARAQTGREGSDRFRLGAWLDALASLPLSLAEADPAAVATLEAAGITTFGQAFALPRAALARRVGEDFVALLDRVRGLVPELRPLFVPPPRYAGKLDLPAPVANVDALAFAVNRLVFELAGWLTGRGLGVTEMSLALAHERYVGIATGVRRHHRQLRARGAGARARASHRGAARAAGARRAARAGRGDHARERGDRPSRRPQPRTAPRRRGRRDRSAARSPARAAGRGRGDARHAARRAPARARVARNEDRARKWNRTRRSRGAPASRKDDADRRFRLALSIAPPARLAACRAGTLELGHRLEAQPWVLRDGPERIESGWWDGADVRRDYFIAENPRGETVWIYRDHRYGIDDGEWFLHGVIRVSHGRVIFASTWRFGWRRVSANPG